MKLFSRLFLLSRIFAVVLLFSSAVFADSLTDGQITRVKAYKFLIQDVDQKSLRQTIEELENMPYTEENLQIMEAMAKAYAHIAREQDVVKQRNKDWLYGQIAMNMAYLQMGGSNPTGGNASLSRLICRKLKEHLSEELLSHPVLFRPFKY